MPETLTGMELLEQMRDEPSRMMFVVDEYGEVQGLLTPLDLLEAITGELKPDTQTEAWATERADGSWLLDGLMPVNELKSRLDIKDLPAEDKGRYNTLAGLLLLYWANCPWKANASIWVNGFLKSSIWTAVGSTKYWPRDWHKTPDNRAVLKIFTCAI